MFEILISIIITILLFTLTHYGHKHNQAWTRSQAAIKGWDTRRK